jgi:hypothetical protein
MQPSLILCRAQEARQRALADESTLENVKLVAFAAAAAWAKEAKIAEQREDRKLRSRAAALALSAGEPPSLRERSFSENPDRGHATLSASEAGVEMLGGRLGSA